MPYLEANLNKLPTFSEYASRTNSARIEQTINPNKNPIASFRNRFDFSMYNHPQTSPEIKPQESTKIATVLENPIYELNDYIQNLVKNKESVENIVELPDINDINIVKNTIEIKFSEQLNKEQRDSFINDFVLSLQKYLNDNPKYSSFTISTIMPLETSPSNSIKFEIVNKSLLEPAKMDSKDEAKDLDRGTQLSVLEAFLKSKKLKIKTPLPQELDTD